MKKILEMVNSIGPNGTCKIKKRGGLLIKETVTMASRREFFLSQKITKRRTSKYLLKKLTIFLHDFFGDEH